MATRTNGTTTTTYTASTPGVTKAAKVTVTIAGGGTSTVDLTAVADDSGVVVDFSALKIFHLSEVAGLTNTHESKVHTGGTNGYRAVTGRDWSDDLPYGGAKGGHDWAGHALAVGGGNKTIDVVGTAGEVVVINIDAGP